MESKFKYTVERNVQIVIALLKAHGIRRVIASPGTTNMTFVVSIQNDPWFQIWSSVDERSAAYLACGMAAETGEPVVISCTGATASRNYMPGLTEAYYRKLPILAITSTRGNHRIGHLIDQQIDRRTLPNDISIESVTIPIVKDREDERMCEIDANKAILALSLNGGGPVHINMYTKYSNDFRVSEIPHVNVIYRHTAFDKSFPVMPTNAKIIIYVGSHCTFSDRLTASIDKFCAVYDAVVLCDHTSGYRGQYEIHYQLVCGQKKWHSELCNVNLCIHIGEVTGDQFKLVADRTWRVSPDGVIRDTFGNIERVFMMPEEFFFEKYAIGDTCHKELFLAMTEEVNIVENKIPELPFSNLWIAQHMVDILPPNCELHFGIYHSLRSWNFFKLPANINAKSNVGGFGIDGGLSAIMGASFAAPNKLFFGIFGDLAFFYDMNVLGNRHVGNNVRLLLINNGLGNEFRNYNHPCCFLGESANDFVAAAGHYGNKSRSLVRNYAIDLGYKYLTASNKSEFNTCIIDFLNPNMEDKPMILEVFTDKDDESNALELILNVISDPVGQFKHIMRDAVKSVIGKNNINKMKKIVRK